MYDTSWRTISYLYVGIIRCRMSDSDDSDIRHRTLAKKPRWYLEESKDPSQDVSKFAWWDERLYDFTAQNQLEVWNLQLNGTLVLMWFNDPLPLRLCRYYAAQGRYKSSTDTLCKQYEKARSVAKSVRTFKSFADKRQTDWNPYDSGA